MLSNEIISHAKEKMQKSIHAFQDKLSTLRTGRASVHQFENIQVECYGSTSPLKQIANINSPESRLITIQAWDNSILRDIEKAIQKTMISINPQNDGKILRIQIPPLTDETRQQNIKLSKNYEEESKVAIRNIRREANEKLKKLEQNKEISKDELTGHEQEIQKLTDEYIKQLDLIQGQKAKEIIDD